MLPGAARVGRFVDAVAYGEIGAAQAFATSNIDRVGIGRRNREGSDGTGGLIIEDGIPGAAEVRRFPDSAVIRRHVEDIRLARNAGNRHGAAAAKWSDHPPVKFLVHGRVIGLCGERERKKRNAEHGEQSPEESLVHGWSSKKGKDKPQRRGLDSAGVVTASRA